MSKPSENSTPMMQQYQAIKAENPGSILFFRLGDFYEMFGSDALEASKILDITLTARNKSTNPVPMCGIPYHAAAGYIDKLTKAGKKVAICDQVSDPALPGIVRREVVRIITPGTTFSEHVLDRKSNQYVLAIFPQKDYFGIAFADLTTGEFQAAELHSKEALQMELLRLEPAEIVLQREHYDDPDIRAMVIQLSNAPISPCDFYEEAAQFLKSNLSVSTLDGFGISNWPFAVQASALLMRYLLDTQKETLAHIDKITAYHREQWMPLDESTIRNLELFSSIRGSAARSASHGKSAGHGHASGRTSGSNEPDGTLLSILDETQTSMGGRMLRRWLVQPLVRRSEIEARHEAVGNLAADDDFRNKLADELTRLSDLERLLGRLSSSTGTARDLMGLANSLAIVPEIKATLGRNDAKMLKVMERDLEPLEKLTKHICAAILPEPSMKLREGGMIAPGYNSELDELRSLMTDAKTALKNIEQEEIASTGISSLKVKFNKVFGYYIEVSNTNLEKVPEHYMRKQTLVNAERFITPELKEHEEKVLHAEEKSRELEYQLFLEVRELALAEIKAIKKNAHILAELDVILAFAINAIRRNYCRPQILDEPILEIREGRHPVVENMTFEKSFTPNDTDFAAEGAAAAGGAATASKAGAASKAATATESTEIKLITGPNMSGKSTYLRQVALIALMAQIGSFVPAASVRMRVFDRIFTRVGASDNLVRGQSTFMVEMQEAAYIINHATSKSLIILDELGRGTSTYDGMSIAWAVLEHLHDSVRGFTLFATHYHELIELATTLKHAKNYSIDVQETRKGVLFLHKIKEGGIDKSYGIEVARIAGMPAKLVERASTILQDLELEKILAQKALGKIPENQMNMFAQTYASSREPGKVTHPALEKLRDLDINSLTPIEALNTLNELKGLRD